QCASDLGFQLAQIAPATTGAAAARGARRLSPRVAIGAAVIAALAVIIAFVAGRRTTGVAVPHFQQLTFRRGAVLSAAFAPDGQTIVYAGLWEGHPPQLYSTRRESPESQRLNLPPARLLSISNKGVMAIAVGPEHLAGLMAGGTLAEVAIEGSAPRELMN